MTDERHRQVGVYMTTAAWDGDNRTMKNLNWTQARAWEEVANAGGSEIRWRFDCNFKLDYDGPMLVVSSRFYPPHKNDHDGWEGTVNICCAGDEEAMVSKIFRCSSLDELRTEVEAHVHGLAGQVRAAVRLAIVP